MVNIYTCEETIVSFSLIVCHVILETNTVWLGVCMCDLGLYTICCGVMFLIDLAKYNIERIL